MLVVIFLVLFSTVSIGQKRVHGGQEKVHGGQKAVNGGQERVHGGQERVHGGQKGVNVPNDQDTGCKQDDNQCSAEAFCHRNTRLCVCYNGASSYPMCKQPPNVDTNNNTCTDCEGDNVICDSQSGKCMCEFGGMHPNCCTSKCGMYETCYRKKCVCMYGRNRQRNCNRCKEKCKKNEKCSKRGTTYQCRCRYGLHHGSCKKKPKRAVTTTPPAPKCPSTGKIIYDEFDATNSKELFFNATCTKGCFKIHEVAHCCKDEPWKCTKHVEQIKDVCEGQEVCKFRLAPSEFGAECPESMVRVRSSCNNGKLKENHSIKKCITTIPISKQDLKFGDVFNADCTGGCIHIDKALWDCSASADDTADTALIRRLCEGKETCTFNANSDTFGKSPCGGQRERAWTWWECGKLEE